MLFTSEEKKTFFPNSMNDLDLFSNSPSLNLELFYFRHRREQKENILVEKSDQRKKQNEKKLIK